MPVAARDHERHRQNGDNNHLHGYVARDALEHVAQAAVELQRADPERRGYAEENGEDREYIYALPIGPSTRSPSMAEASR